MSDIFFRTEEEKAEYMAMSPDAPTDTEPSFTYDEELGNGYFVMYPSAMMKSEKYKPEAKVMYGVLLSYASRGETAFPGREKLMKDINCGKREYYEALEQLTENGLVEVTRRGLGRTNLFHVHKFRLGVKSRRPNAETPDVTTEGHSDVTTSGHQNVNTSGHKVYTGVVDTGGVDTAKSNAKEGSPLSGKPGKKEKLNDDPFAEGRAPGQVKPSGLRPSPPSLQQQAMEMQQECREPLQAVATHTGQVSEVKPTCVGVANNLQERVPNPGKRTWSNKPGSTPPQERDIKRFISNGEAQHGLPGMNPLPGKKPATEGKITPLEKAISGPDIDPSRNPLGWFKQEYARKFGYLPTVGNFGQAAREMRTLVDTHGPEEVKQRVIRFFSDTAQAEWGWRPHSFFMMFDKYGPWYGMNGNGNGKKTFAQSKRDSEQEANERALQALAMGGMFDE